MSKKPQPQNKEPQKNKL